MKNVAIHDSAIHSILAAIDCGGPKVWPVLISRGRWRAEPAIYIEGSGFWVEEAPRVLPIAAARFEASRIAHDGLQACSA